MKNVLIIGANYSNKGAEAMLKTVRTELKKRQQEITFYMTCREYEKALAKKDGFEPVFYRLTKLDKYKRKIRGKLYKTITGKELKHARRFSIKAVRATGVAFDAIIDISGFSYSDYWGPKLGNATTRLMTIFNKNTTKLYFMPQAWGSFDNAKVAHATVEMLKKAKKFYARDHISRKYLAELLNKPVKEIPLSPDIALIFHKGITEQKELFSELGYNGSQKLKVGISPNMRMYETASGDGQANTYVNLLIKTIRQISAKHNADIFLIPNEIRPEGVATRDDRFLCGLLHKALSDLENCYNFDRYYDAEDIKTIIGELDVLIGSRYHALIFALSQNIPAIALSWSHKYEELFSLYGIDPYVIGQDQMTYPHLYHLFTKLEKNRAGISETLLLKNTKIQPSIEKLFDSLSF